MNCRMLIQLFLNAAIVVGCVICSYSGSLSAEESSSEGSSAILPEIDNSFLLKTRGGRVETHMSFRQTLPDISSFDYPYYAYVNDNCVYLYDVEKRQYFEYMEKLTSEYFRSEQAKGDIEGLQFERGKILHVHSLLEILSIDLETKKTAQPRYFSTCAYPKFYADRMLRSIKQGFLISSLVEDYYHRQTAVAIREGGRDVSSWSLLSGYRFAHLRIVENRLLGIVADLEKGSISDTKVYKDDLDPSLSNPYDTRPGSSRWDRRDYVRNSEGFGIGCVSGKDLLCCVFDNDGLKTGLKENAEQQGLFPVGYDTETRTVVFAKDEDDADNDSRLLRRYALNKGALVAKPPISLPEGSYRIRQLARFTYCLSVYRGSKYGDVRFADVSRSRPVVKPAFEIHPTTEETMNNMYVELLGFHSRSRTAYFTICRFIPTGGQVEECVSTLIAVQVPRLGTESAE